MRTGILLALGGLAGLLGPGVRALATDRGASPDDDPGARVELAYRLAFGRKPDPDERAQAVRVVERLGAATLARALFNSNEFLCVSA